jgi:hypothetical protein
VPPKKKYSSSRLIHNITDFPLIWALDVVNKEVHVYSIISGVSMKKFEKHRFEALPREEKTERELTNEHKAKYTKAMSGEQSI